MNIIGYIIMMTFFVNLLCRNGVKNNKQHLMIPKSKIGRIVSGCLFIVFSSYAHPATFKNCLNIRFATHPIQQDNVMADTGNNIKILKNLNSDFQRSITEGDTSGSRQILNLIYKNLRKQNNDNLTVSNSQYFIGVYYLLQGNNIDAVRWLKLSLSIREQKMCYDTIHSKSLFNLGIAYSNMGDIRQMENYTLRSLEVEKKLYGEFSPLLLGSLSALVSAYVGLNEYAKAISYGDWALSLQKGNGPGFLSEMTVLYINIGACYAQMGDYSKAVRYLEQAESLYKEHSIPEDANYINLLNSLAASYFFLGMNEQSDEYFNRGIEKIGTSYSGLSLNFLNSFAVILGNSGKVKEGESMLLSSLLKAGNSQGEGSRDYFEMLKNYADYLRTFKIDIKRSLLAYEKCIDYLKNHEEDISLAESVYIGYALALADTGESQKALEIIQMLLFSGISSIRPSSPMENPDLSLIEPDQWSIKVLKAKYRILWDIYIKNRNEDYLLAASEISEIIINLLEKVRINISEDDSRLILGDRYRDSYLFAIRDFNLCYKNTGEIKYRDKAFEYSEKSKVAGLLASTRELKATQFHIPSDIAELERNLKTELRYYEAKIYEENSKNSPDPDLISEWKGLILTATHQRDSLIAIFEKQYPKYFSIKYNTQVIKQSDIPNIAGRNINYLNYIVSDTVLYIFLVNRRNTYLATVSIDSTFFRDIREFRNLLSMPMNNARMSYYDYTTIGTNLYRKIIGPVRKYFISNKLLISPDNILAYIPFEAIPVSQVHNKNIVYNDIPFLMREYSISYTYSATLLAESVKRSHSTLAKGLVAFAPAYAGSLDTDSLLESRQTGKSQLNDLRFARMEAEFVTDITGGKLYINNAARESVYKSEAGGYDIIHLAMHTLLNDTDPMHSKMLFYREDNSKEDGNLNTYEVYGIPLQARMVILSSCNTGTGVLHSGEGIISLARGFIYAGSQSVIMSLWEIDDKSGAEIMKSFYKYLKRGKTKSNALRKARIDYLESADMLRSHPYFWSSLVIYGSNKPIYHSVKPVIIAASLVSLLFFVLYFIYWKPK